MGKNYDSSKLKDAAGRKVSVTSSVAGNVYLTVESNDQLLSNLGSRNKKTTLTVYPTTTSASARGKRLSSALVATVDGDTIEVRTYESGKISIALLGEWGMTWGTLPRKRDGGGSEIVYSFRKFA